jgi:glycosidase
LPNKNTTPHKHVQKTGLYHSTILFFLLSFIAIFANDFIVNNTSSIYIATSKIMRKILYYTAALLLIAMICHAQPSPISVERIEPTNWFVGLQNPEVELLIHGSDIGTATPSMKKYKGVKITKIEKTNNPNYLFVTLNISKNAKPGELILFFEKQSRATIEYKYQLRNKNNNGAQGLHPADFVYLIMPDRFANGNPKNDNLPTTNEPTADRTQLKTRHGGDLRGIINHLDYLEKLGVTALWLNPVQANDQPKESYHGYAFTEHYHIDPRLGTDAEYQELIDKCHAKGIKIVMDYVHNHTGDQHYLIKDLPDPNWIHRTDTFVRTTYRTTTLLDPHAAQADRKQFANGWFDYPMPDLNQQDPHVAKYLIQNNVWWVAQSGIDAYRIDTYSYPDMDFMKEFARVMHNEFPTLTTFGEVWVDFAPVQAAFTQNNNLLKNYNSNLGGVTDFNLYYALTKAFNQDFGWDTGVMQLYHSLAQDFLYEDASRNVVFIDNHDLSRYLSIVNEDTNKLKMAIGVLLTTRGVPQLYYGTEVLMKNYSNPDALVREDFMGGWAADPTSYFDPLGRSEAQNDMFYHISKIAQWRKTNDAIKNGKLMQFVPQNGVYVYFRYTNTATVMVVVNQNKKEITLPTARFAERTSGFTTAQNIIDNSKSTLNSPLSIAAQSTTIFELK